MLIALLFLILSASPQIDSLRSIERYIQNDPAKALDELKGCKGDSFNAPRAKALYSLLYSIALDKNYIDLQSDSIIRYAVDYYSKTGDRYHKFLSYYYLGRICENRADYSAALDNYILSESFIQKDIYPDYFVRLCFAKGRIYVNQFANDKALEESRKAKQYSKGLQNPQFYIRSCLDCSTLLFGLKDYNNAKKELDSLGPWMIDRGIPFPSQYYYTLIRYQLRDDTSSNNDIAESLNNYLAACKQESVSPDRLFCADVFLQMDETPKAKAQFDYLTIKDCISVRDSIRYYGIASRIFRNSADYDNYIQNHEEYDRLSESLVLLTHKNDIRYLEERFQKEQELATQRRHRIYLIILVCALCVLLAASFARSVKRRKVYSIALEEARRDYDFLLQVAGQRVGTPFEIQTILSSRLAALAPYFQGVHTKQLGRQDIARLKHDNQEMLRNIGLLYSLSFPDFVAALVGKGLNAEEIGLCSLYASGFVTKELSSIIDSGSIYHINSSIRAKLGDEVGGRTLPAWLRDLFASCQKV